MTPERPQERDLTRDELREIAAFVAERPELWRDRVRHEEGERVYEQLMCDDHLEVWLICWMGGHDTGFHDHDRSSGAVQVVEGSLREERLLFGAPPSSVEVSAGESFEFESTDIHRVFHPGGKPAISVHAYSPPLRRMGSYAFEPGGALRRQAVGAADELRPLAQAAG